MELYKYQSYGEYKKLQVEYNVQKKELVWAKEKVIRMISKYTSRHIDVLLIMCHGVRNGAEMRMFENNLPRAEVHGTEISYTAEELPNVFIWDFHDLHEQWLDRYDLIYSNSFDHAYNPKKALKAWGQCIKPGGYIAIEHTRNHKDSTKYDPFGVTYKELIVLIKEWLGEKFNIEWVKKYTDGRNTKIIFIRKSK